MRNLHISCDSRLATPMKGSWTSHNRVIGADKGNSWSRWPEARRLVARYTHGSNAATRLKIPRSTHALVAGHRMSPGSGMHSGSESTVTITVHRLLCSRIYWHGRVRQRMCDATSLAMPEWSRAAKIGVLSDLGTAGQPISQRMLSKNLMDDFDSRREMARCPQR